MKRTLLRIVALLFFGYLLISAWAARLLVDDSFHPIHNSARFIIPPNWMRQAARDGAVQDVSVRAGDGAVLRGWLIRSPQPSRGIVLLLHGLGDNRLGTSGQAEILFSNGYDVLMPDSRAHGASGGAAITYGVLEADDVHRWISFALAQPQSEPCVYGIGISMGAAILLQSLREEDRFCGVVAESPFATFREIAYDRIGQPFHLGPWFGKTVGAPLVEAGMLYARLRYGIDLDKASPETAAARSSVPILLIHGSADDNIPPYHTLLIAAKNPAIRVWIVRNGGHGSAISDAPREYRKRLLQFLGSCAQRRTAPKTLAAG